MQLYNAIYIPVLHTFLAILQGIIEHFIYKTVTNKLA